MNVRGMLLIFLISSVSIANAENSAKVLSGRIAHDGPYAIMKQLDAENDGVAWEALLQNIRSGSADWLKVAVSLYPASDAGLADELEGAVSDALDKRPENVLSIAASPFGLGNLCGEPSIDTHDYTDSSGVISAISNRIAVVSRIHDPQLMQDKKSCIDLLTAARERIKKRTNSSARHLQ